MGTQGDGGQLTEAYLFFDLTVGQMSHDRIRIGEPNGFHFHFLGDTQALHQLFNEDTRRSLVVDEQPTGNNFILQRLGGGDVGLWSAASHDDACFNAADNRPRSGNRMALALEPFRQLSRRNDDIHRDLMGFNLVAENRGGGE